MKVIKVSDRTAVMAEHITAVTMDNYGVKVVTTPGTEYRVARGDMSTWNDSAIFDWVCRALAEA